jgi:hypothetical protein
MIQKDKLNALIKTSLFIFTISSCVPVKVVEITFTANESKIPKIFSEFCAKFESIGFQRTLNKRSSEKCWETDEDILKDYEPWSYVSTLNFYCEAEDCQEIKLTLQYRRKDSLAKLTLKEMYDNKLSGYSIKILDKIKIFLEERVDYLEIKKY